jgi:hypothetical protein
MTFELFLNFEKIWGRARSGLVGRSGGEGGVIRNVRYFGGT